MMEQGTSRYLEHPHFGAGLFVLASGEELTVVNFYGVVFSAPEGEFAPLTTHTREEWIAKSKTVESLKELAQPENILDGFDFR